MKCTLQSTTWVVSGQQATLICTSYPHVSRPTPPQPETGGGANPCMLSTKWLVMQYRSNKIASKHKSGRGNKTRPVLSHNPVRPVVAAGANKSNVTKSRFIFDAQRFEGRAKQAHALKQVCHIVQILALFRRVLFNERRHF